MVAGAGSRMEGGRSHAGQEAEMDPPDVRRELRGAATEGYRLPTVGARPSAHRFGGGWEHKGSRGSRSLLLRRHCRSCASDCFCLAPASANDATCRQRHGGADGGPAASLPPGNSKPSVQDGRSKK